MPSLVNKGVFTAIKPIRCLKGLSDESIMYLANHGVMHELDKGAFLWREGEPGEFCCLILSGTVDIFTHSRSGDEKIISLFGPGEFLGLSAMLKHVNYPANALISSKKAQIVKFYIRSMEQDADLKDKREVQTWLREMLLRHEQILRDKISILSAGRLNTKLIELFEHLNARFSETRIKDEFHIPLQLTKTQIAKMIEARVETVIRTLNKWEKSGYFEMNSHGIILRKLNDLKAQEDAS